MISVCSGGKRERNFGIHIQSEFRDKLFVDCVFVYNSLDICQVVREQTANAIASVDNLGFSPHMSEDLPNFFHLHLVSDATGETLTTIAKAAAVQYAQVRAIEHVHPLIRTEAMLRRVLKEIEQTPGIVLYTIINPKLSEQLEARCRDLQVPCMAVLQPVMSLFESYLGAPQTPNVAGQHVLDTEYFQRIEALNFTMAHDDGHLPEDLDQADIIILGISRTSKTPMSIYLAQRGFKTTNLPLVPDIPIPERLTDNHSAFVVCLVASLDRLTEVRRNRAMILADRDIESYVDRDAIAAELSYSRRLCAQHGWPILDVTRKSVEEAAATVLRMKADRDEATNNQTE